MPVFQLELQFDDKGAVTAVRQLGKVSEVQSLQEGLYHYLRFFQRQTSMLLQS